MKHAKEKHPQILQKQKPRFALWQHLLFFFLRLHYTTEMPFRQDVWKNLKNNAGAARGILPRAA